MLLDRDGVDIPFDCAIDNIARSTSVTTHAGLGDAAHTSARTCARSE